MLGARQFNTHLPSAAVAAPQSVPSTPASTHVLQAQGKSIAPGKGNGPSVPLPTSTGGGVTTGRAVVPVVTGRGSASGIATGAAAVTPNSPEDIEFTKIWGSQMANANEEDDDGCYLADDVGGQGMQIILEGAPEFYQSQGTPYSAVSWSAGAGAPYGSRPLGMHQVGDPGILGDFILGQPVKHASTADYEVTPN
jgi:hypothetical protein